MENRTDLQTPTHRVTLSQSVFETTMLFTTAQRIKP